MTITGPAVVGGSTSGSTPAYVFGFGSLVHNPGFVHAERVPGYIKGYKVRLPPSAEHTPVAADATGCRCRRPLPLPGAAQRRPPAGSRTCAPPP